MQVGRQYVTTVSLTATASLWPGMRQRHCHRELRLLSTVGNADDPDALENIPDSFLDLALGTISSASCSSTKAARLYRRHSGHARDGDGPQAEYSSPPL